MWGGVACQGYLVSSYCLCWSTSLLQDALLAYMNAQAIKHDIRPLIENKSKFALVRSSSGHRHALKEVMQDPIVQAQLSDAKVRVGLGCKPMEWVRPSLHTQAQVEVRTLEQFYKLLNEDPDRAFYGYNHVAKANEANAIDKLLVTDSLFRSQELATRKRYVALVDSVKDNAGEVLVFSSLHVSGERMY